MSDSGVGSLLWSLLPRWTARPWTGPAAGTGTGSLPVGCHGIITEPKTEPLRFHQYRYTWSLPVPVVFESEWGQSLTHKPITENSMPGSCAPDTGTMSNALCNMILPLIEKGIAVKERKTPKREFRIAHCQYSTPHVHTGT